MGALMSRLSAVSEDGNARDSFASILIIQMPTASLLKRSTYNFCRQTQTSHGTEGILKSNVIEVSDIPSWLCENDTETVPLPIAA